VEKKSPQKYYFQNVDFMTPLRPDYTIEGLPGDKIVSILEGIKYLEDMPSGATK